MDGQITITEYFASKIAKKEVMSLTDFINSQGRSQYKQIGDVIERTYENAKDTEHIVDKLTNAVSVYIHRQSMRYMDYLRKEADL